MIQPVRGARSRTILALLVATAVTIVTLDFRGFGPLERVTDAARDGAEGAASAFAVVTRPVTNVWQGITDYDRLREENDRLRAELEALRAERVDEANARQQLDEILAQEGITTPSGIDRQLARVVAGAPSNFENTLRIDKGSEDDVEEGMVVVTDAGLVGRVAETFGSRSVVQLADTRGFGVGVRLVGESSATFLARGQGPGRDLLLQGEVDADTGITDGATVVTSGLEGSVFPPDILVGRVTGTGLGPAGEVTVPTVPGGEDRPLTGVEVKLFVEPRDLSYVTVLMSGDED